MLQWWTIGRATGMGAAAGLIALTLWPLYAAIQEPLRLPYLAALIVAAFCGGSILWITTVDLLFHRRRGHRLVPLRVFDVTFALLLLVPSMTALSDLAA